LFRILNLDHWDLPGIFFLVLGVFMIFIKRAIFEYLANYLCK
jgi:hypothetical protein